MSLHYLESKFVVFQKVLFQFNLSRYLKELIHRRAFEDDEAVIMTINEWIEEQDQNFFCEGVKALQQRWGKCVDFRRNCV